MFSLNKPSLRRGFFYPLIFPAVVCAFILAPAPRALAQAELIIGIDPLGILGICIGAKNESGERVEPDIRNMWLTMDFSWLTRGGHEAGAGFTVSFSRVTLNGHYRFFSNNERQSGFFWGAFGSAGWQQMYWLINKDDGELFVGPYFPFKGQNVFSIVGVTVGMDIGYRIRNDRFGITLFAGGGLPLFYAVPPGPEEDYTVEFMSELLILRAIHIGIRIDLVK